MTKEHPKIAVKFYDEDKLLLERQSLELKHEFGEKKACHEELSAAKQEERRINETDERW